jgi:hypothetical protein
MPEGYVVMGKMRLKKPDYCLCCQLPDAGDKCVREKAEEP